MKDTSRNPSRYSTPRTHLQASSLENRNPQNVLQRVPVSFLRPDGTLSHEGAYRVIPFTGDRALPSVVAWKLHRESQGLTTYKPMPQF